jgi:hypothetical protein
LTFKQLIPKLQAYSTLSKININEISNSFIRKTAEIHMEN